MITHFKSLILFGIKSAQILKRNLIVNYLQEKLLITKVKSYGDEATDFHNKEMPKINSDYTCSAVINVDSGFKKDENYFLPVFLEE